LAPICNLLPRKEKMNAERIHATPTTNEAQLIPMEQVRQLIEELEKTGDVIMRDQNDSLLEIVLSEKEIVHLTLFEGIRLSNGVTDWKHGTLAVKLNLREPSRSLIHTECRRKDDPRMFPHVAYQTNGK